MTEEQTLDEILNEDDGDQFLSELGIEVKQGTETPQQVSDLHNYLV